MNRLRTLPTRRLLAGLAVLVAVVVAGAVAVSALGSQDATPPPKPLAQALHEAVAAPRPQGITARITFTNQLFPSGALLGRAGSALMSGASGRLWVTNDHRGRLELQADAGDAQIVWNGDRVTIYDASSNTVYRAKLPPQATTSSHAGSDRTPSLDQISTWLADLVRHAAVSDARPDNLAGQPAYRVSISPKHDGGLLGSAELAWDATHGTPLRVAVYAQGSTSPALALTVTDISYGPVSAGDVDVSPPPGAKVVDLGSTTGSHGAPGTKVSGLDAVRAAVSFPLAAPDTLVGLPRRSVQLLTGGDAKGAVVVYGEGLGGLVVVERPDGARSSGTAQLQALPKISVNGVTGSELATQLGTVVQFSRGGVDYVLAGSLPPAAAEAAARELG